MSQATDPSDSLQSETPRHPLLAALETRHGIPTLGAEHWENLQYEPRMQAIMIAGDPARYPEALDLAVILPELCSVFSGRFDAWLLDPSLEDSFKREFGIALLPSLIFVKQRKFHGKLARVLDWQDYLESIPAILTSEPHSGSLKTIPITVAEPAPEQTSGTPS